MGTIGTMAWRTIALVCIACVLAISARSEDDWAEQEKDGPRQRGSRISKMGLVCSNGHMFKGGCNETHLAPFTDKAQLKNNDGMKFYYNYEPSLPASIKSLLQQQKVEFVPMVGWRHFWLNPPGYTPSPKCAGTFGKCSCYMTNPALAPANAPGQEEGDIRCEVGDLVALLEQTMTGMYGKARPKYLMGFNEPEDTHFKHKNISPEEAVYYWRTFLQPAAKQLGLALVTPTVNLGFCGDHPYGCDRMGTWLANFLKVCYNHKNVATNPCDVESIKAISYHGYECFESYWTEKFSKTGTFFNDMKAQLSGTSQYDWDNWVNTRPIWVTEHNCNNDNVGSLMFKDMMPLADMTEVCERISGQAADQKCQPCDRDNGPNIWGDFKWGKGSIQAMEELPMIDRYSWWNTWNKGQSTVAAARVLNARLVDDEAEPYPHGLALQQGLTSDCSQGAAPPDYTAQCKDFCVDQIANDPTCDHAETCGACTQDECSQCRDCLH